MPTVTADQYYHIDLSLSNAFTTFIAFKPETLTFDDQIRGPGNCSWTVSLNSVDEDDNQIISNSSILKVPNTDLIGPYRHYYRLRYGNVVIQAGVVTSTNILADDNFISMAGKTWEHFLEKWQYPFDARAIPYDLTSHVNDYRFLNVFNNDETTASGGPTPTGLTYVGLNRDVIRILKDVLTVAMTVPGGNRPQFDLSTLSSLSGIKIPAFTLPIGDSTFMNDFVNRLAQTKDGFDWWISHDKKFFWATPYRFGDPGNPTVAYSIDNSTPLEKGGIGYGNNGPVATHVKGEGSGLAVDTTLARTYGYQPGHNEFTRLDADYTFGDIRNKNELIDLTHKQLSLDLQPQHDIPLKLDPSKIPDFWSTFRKGRAIDLDYVFLNDWHHLGADPGSTFQIKSFQASDSNNSGNITVNFSIEQKYDLSLNAGQPEG